MLDNASLIGQRDPQDALGHAAGQPGQLVHDFELADTRFARTVNNIVFAGMGGSALAAELAMTFPEIRVPFVICKQYKLPAFVDENTLVICASYSGNTEETLEALTEADGKGAMIAVITHGGRLLELSKNKYCLAELPECPQPRTGIFYAFRALIEILVAAKAADSGSIKLLTELEKPLAEAVKQWTAEVPGGRNEAKRLAEAAIGKTAIIYAGPLMYPAAYKWKINFNENAKNTAWSNSLPEFNHNEFIGWSSHPVEKPFAVFDLMSTYEHPRVLKRFETSDRLLSGMRPKANPIYAEGGSALEHMLYLILLGDFVTTYTAILNGVNPTPVELVERFKKELG